jgi:hypothetical protein
VLTASIGGVVRGMTVVRGESMPKRSPGVGEPMHYGMSVGC